MKRQTRPFLVEIKQSRHSPGKSAVKSLWGGHDLHLLKEAQPERQAETRPAPPPEQSLPAAAPPARILAALIAPLPIDGPVAVPVRAKPKTPRVQPPAARSVQAPAAAAVQDPMPSPPVGLRDRTGETLPRGQRWKRRLPKVIW